MKALPIVLLLYASRVWGGEEVSATPIRYQEKVAYSYNHDPGIIVLADGRKLTVLYSGIKWETVNQWGKGRPLTISYSPDTGVLLIDQDSKRGIEIVSGLEKHPIDLLTDQRLEKDRTTFGAGDAYVFAAKLWEREVERATAAMIEEVETGRARAALTESRVQWRKFQQAEIRAIREIYDRDGSIWKVVSAQRTVELNRDQALRLNRMRAW